MNNYIGIEEQAIKRGSSDRYQDNEYQNPKRIIEQLFRDIDNA